MTRFFRLLPTWLLARLARWLIPATADALEALTVGHVVADGGRAVFRPRHQLDARSRRVWGEAAAQAAGVHDVLRMLDGELPDEPEASAPGT